MAPKTKSKSKRKTERRTRIKPGKKEDSETFYVVRRADGKFKDWQKIPRSIAMDAKKKAKNVPTKPGRGHQGDYPKKKKGSKGKGK